MPRMGGEEDGEIPLPTGVLPGLYRDNACDAAGKALNATAKGG